MNLHKYFPSMHTVIIYELPSRPPVGTIYGFPETVLPKRDDSRLRRFMICYMYLPRGRTPWGCVRKTVRPYSHTRKNIKLSDRKIKGLDIVNEQQETMQTQTAAALPTITHILSMCYIHEFHPDTAQWFRCTLMRLCHKGEIHTRPIPPGTREGRSDLNSIALGEKNM